MEPRERGRRERGRRERGRPGGGRGAREEPLAVPVVVVVVAAAGYSHTQREIEREVREREVRETEKRTGCLDEALAADEPLS